MSLVTNNLSLFRLRSFLEWEERTGQSGKSQCGICRYHENNGSGMDTTPCWGEAEVHAGCRTGPSEVPEGTPGVSADWSLQELRPATAAATCSTTVASAATAEASYARSSSATGTGISKNATLPITLSWVCQWIYLLYLLLKQQQPAAHSSHSQVQPQPYIQQIQTYNPQLHIVQHMQPGQQHQQQQQHSDRSNNAAGHRPDGSGNQVGVFDIPIFTEEFLDHNKGIIFFLHAALISLLIFQV